MRSTIHDTGEFLKASALKKPYLQDLIKRSEMMSISEIEGLSERKWIIQGLLALKKKGDELISLNNAEIIANSMEIPVDQISKDIGDVYILMSDNYWLVYGKMSIEVKYGDLLFLRSNNIISYEHITTKVDSSVLNLKLHQLNIEYKHYRMMVSEKLSRDFPNAPEISNISGLSSSNVNGHRVFTYSSYK